MTDFILSMLFIMPFYVFKIFYKHICKITLSHRYHLQEGPKACYEGPLRSGYAVSIPDTRTKLLEWSKGGHYDAVGQSFPSPPNATSWIPTSEVIELFIVYLFLHVLLSSLCLYTICFCKTFCYIQKSSKLCLIS